MASIAVIDYGMGNLRSVSKALEHVTQEHRIVVTQSARDVLAADRVVFPGQGAIRDCMRELHRLDLTDVLREAAATKPFLGICLGPQALMEFSEENGGVAGLGIMPGKVAWFGNKLRNGDTGFRAKIPHMGWNRVHQIIAHPLWHGIPQESWFYFVHSYYLQPPSPETVAGETEYGFRFTSVIARDNLFAVQFHPEKSAQAGLRLLANFARWQAG